MPDEPNNVLIVDDEHAILDVVSRELSAAGFTCITAENGQQALEQFSNPDTFVAVVTDLVMPVMDGLELAEKIRELDSDIPVIILTGHATLGTAREGYKRGVYHYLIKPDDFDYLRTCVARAAQFTRLLRAEKNRKQQLEIEVKTRTEELEFQRAALEISHRRIAGVIEEANFGLLVIGQMDEIFLMNRRDKEAVRTIMVHILEDCGYTVLAAANSQEAERIFDEHGSEVDLLLTYVVLPDHKGPELYKRLTITDPGLKVLYISGYTGNGIARHGILEAPFLQKPFTAEALAQKVRDVLDMAGTRRTD